MGKWKVTLDNGQVHEIEAPDEASARAGMERMLSLPVVDPGNPVQGATDTLRAVGDTLSYGLTDTLRSKLYGTPVEQERKATEEGRARAGLPGAVAEGVAAVLEPSPAGEVALGGRALRTAGHAFQGGAEAFLDKWGHGERNPWELAKSTATGSGLSGAISGIADPMLSWASRRSQRAGKLQGQQYRSPEEMAQAKTAKYEEVGKAGVSYEAREARKLAAALRQIENIPGVDKKVLRYRKELERNWRGKDITPAELDKVRADTREILETHKATRKGRLGRQFVKAMDKFAETSPVTRPSATGVGPPSPAPQTVKRTLKEARDLAHREERHKIVREAANKAERLSMAGRFNPFTPSVESATVKKFSDVEEKALAGNIKGKFTPEEQAKINDIYTGGSKYSLRNLGGMAERLSFTGGQVPWWASVAAFPLSGGTSLLAQGGAELLQRAGARATKREIEELEALIRDPMGKGLGPIRADPDAVNAAKQRLAKLTASTYRSSPANRRNRGED